VNDAHAVAVKNGVKNRYDEPMDFCFSQALYSSQLILQITSSESFEDQTEVVFIFVQV
jgi:hypothetical protein